jgi:thiamine-monophosphate kinase
MTSDTTSSSPALAPPAAPDVTVAALGEHALVERIASRARLSGPHVLVGIGDDAAVTRPERGAVEVTTTDSLVEHVHFRRDWTPLASVGHKALAVNLSDLAAMGAVPQSAFLSLILPAELTVADFDALVGGFLDLATAARVSLIGGNISRSPGPLIVDVTAVGSVRQRRVLRRAGARAGHELYVTGTLGAAAAGLAMFEAGRRRGDGDAVFDACFDHYERPDARWRVASVIARTGAASAAIDLSDGLADAARRLAEAAGLGVVVEAAAVPVDPGARAWAETAGRDALAFAVEGGEDYEVAFAVAPRQRRKFLAAARRGGHVPVTRVGRFVAEPGAWLERDDGRRNELAAGFVHF